MMCMDGSRRTQEEVAKEAGENPAILHLYKEHGSSSPWAKFILVNERCNMVSLAEADWMELKNDAEIYISGTSVHRIMCACDPECENVCVNVCMYECITV